MSATPWPGTWSCDRYACLKAAGRTIGQRKVLRGLWSAIAVCSYCGGVGANEENKGSVLRISDAVRIK
jgi:hypothetical protein